MEVLEKAVAQRVEGTQVEERADNKMWLVRYLEVRYDSCTISFNL
jgi:exocyst complex component 3